MNVVSILSGIKGKVLDAAHFDLLRSAYDLQAENTKQLKSNNDALSDSNGLLKERIDKLETEIGRLKAENADLRARAADRTAENTKYQPTGLPRRILLLYRQVDEHLLFDKQVASVLANSQLEVEAAFLKLTEEKIVRWGIFSDRGTGYFLTNTGTRLVLSLEPE